MFLILLLQIYAQDNNENEFGRVLKLNYVPNSGIFTSSTSTGFIINEEDSDYKSYEPFVFEEKLAYQYSKEFSVSMDVNRDIRSKIYEFQMVLQGYVRYESLSVELRPYFILNRYAKRGWSGLGLGIYNENIVLDFHFLLALLRPHQAVFRPYFINPKLLFRFHNKSSNSAFWVLNLALIGEEIISGTDAEFKSNMMITSGIMIKHFFTPKVSLSSSFTMPISSTITSQQGVYDPDTNSLTSTTLVDSSTTLAFRDFMGLIIGVNLDIEF